MLVQQAIGESQFLGLRFVARHCGIAVCYQVIAICAEIYTLQQVGGKKLFLSGKTKRFSINIKGNTPTKYDIAQQGLI